MPDSASYIAGGNISPSRFVSVDANGDNTVVQAGLNDQILGISQKGTRQVPIPSASSYAAIDGDSLLVHIDGADDVLLEYGATVTRGQRLKSDANGKGIPVATSGEAQKVGAIALQSGSAGDVRPVLVKTQIQPATPS